MSDKVEEKFVCPVGHDFLRLVSEQEDECEAESHKHISELGRKVPALMENLGTVLSLLDRTASCFWGCRGGDHVIEYLAGRVCSCSRASLRLVLFGFYDESLSLTRSIGEIANLPFLFNQDGAALAQWVASDKRQRKAQFGPVKVRLRLEALNVPVIIDEVRYSELCEVGTHPTPQTKPQAHNVLGRPVAGAIFQELGTIVALNELAVATAFAFIPLPKLLVFSNERTKEIHQACRALAESSGGLNLLNVKEMIAEIRNDSAKKTSGKERKA